MMKRLTGLSALLVTIFMLSLTTAQAQGVVTDVRETVRFRAGPGTDWLILAELAPGTALNLDARDGTNNFWVRGIAPDGTVGWAASSFLNVSEAQLNTLPIKGPNDPFSLAAPAADAAPVQQAEAMTAEEAPAEEVIAAAPAVPPAAAAQSLAPMGGFGYGAHVQSLGPAAFGYAQSAGMTWLKVQTRYSDGQSPESVAGVINTAKGSGFRILLGVVGAPSDLLKPGYNDRYAAFVAGLAAQGADGIEIWNEPNIDREWPSGQISPQNYTNLLAVSYNAIKAANPGTMVVSGAPAPTGFFGGCSPAGCDDLPFIQGMNAAGAANFMACVGVHYNEGILPPTARSGDPRGNSGYYTRYYQPMIETYSGAFGGRVPLCFTEMGYLTPEGYGPLPGGFAWAQNVTVAQQAAWVDGAVDIARRSGRVRLVIIWNLDFTGFGADPMGGYALVRPDGSCPACAALAN
ncbi:MAG: SH3 domain-containing protein [Chloroflexota bacterium]